MRIRLTRRALGLMLVGIATAAAAQGRGTLEPEALPPLEQPDDPGTPAKQLFGRVVAPTLGRSRVEGFYSNGCVAGAVALPITGPVWQVMRLSRNRNWGHPALIRFLEKLAATVHKAGAWNGLLVGDMSQPRGGPMLTGHASHQVGLDADIWLTPMPGHELTRQEREEMSAVMMVADDRKHVDPKVWTSGQTAVMKTAARDPQVERIFVNAAIKKAMCSDSDPDRSWLTKVRPYWGHDYHFHVRLHCPADSPDCRPQRSPPPGDGCGKELDWWFSDEVLHPKAQPPQPPKPPLTMANLPPACRTVLAAPEAKSEPAARN